MNDLHEHDRIVVEACIWAAIALSILLFILE